MAKGNRAMLAWSHAAPVTSLAAAAAAPHSGTGISSGSADRTDDLVATTAADGVARVWQLSSGGDSGMRSAPLLECR